MLAPDASDHRVEIRPCPAEFDHLRPNRLQGERPKVFRWDRAVEFSQDAKAGSVAINLGSRFAVLEIVSFGVTPERETDDYHTRVGIDSGFVGSTTDIRSGSTDGKGIDNYPARQLGDQFAVPSPGFAAPILAKVVILPST